MAANKTATKAPASNGAKQKFVEINGVAVPIAPPDMLAIAGKAYPVVKPGADVHVIAMPVGSIGTEKTMGGDAADEYLRTWVRAGFTLLEPQVIGTQVDQGFVVNVLFVFVKYE